MGLRGPEPLTSEQLFSRGSRHARRRLEQERRAVIARNTTEALTTEQIENPGDLGSDQANAFWKSYCQELVDAGLLNTRTYIGFVMLCCVWADYHDAQQIIYEQGELVKGSRGQLKKNPAVQIREKAFDQFTKLAQRFGIVP